MKCDEKRIRIHIRGAMNRNADIEPEHGTIDLRKYDSEAATHRLLRIEFRPPVEGVARVRFNGEEAPCVQLPAIEFRSSLNRPSNVPPIAGTAIFTTDPWSVTAPLIG